MYFIGKDQGIAECVCCVCPGISWMSGAARIKKGSPVHRDFLVGNWCSRGFCTTAQLVSENSQDFSASAFATGLLGSCFGACSPKGILAFFAEHFVSGITGNVQTSVWTEKWPARRVAEACLIFHCVHLFPCVSTSGAAAELLHHLTPAHMMGTGEMILKDLTCSWHSTRWLQLCAGTDSPPLEWNVAVGWCCTAMLNAIFGQAMKDPAVSAHSNGLGDRTEMPWWNLPLLLALAWHTRAAHYQTFVLPYPEYKAVFHWHGWLFSFCLDSVAELQQAFQRQTEISSYHLLQPTSVLPRLSLVLLQWSAQQAFKGRCSSGAKILAFIFGLESCSWNSKHEIFLETFFVCLSEEIAGRRRPVSWTLKEKPIGSEYTGDII